MAVAREGWAGLPHPLSPSAPRGALRRREPSEEVVTPPCRHGESHPDPWWLLGYQGGLAGGCNVRRESKNHCRGRATRVVKSQKGGDCAGCARRGAWVVRGDYSPMPPKTSIHRVLGYCASTKSARVQEGAHDKDLDEPPGGHGRPNEKHRGVPFWMTCRQMGTRSHGLKAREAGAAQRACMHRRLRRLR